MATNMTFIDFITTVPADWLNNVNAFVNNGTNIPSSNQVNIGLSYTLVETFGARGNGVELTSANIVATQSTLTVSGNYFVPTDVGKVVVIEGAGTSGDVMNTTIASYISASSVTLTGAAATTVTNAVAFFGTNDEVAIQQALNNSVAVGFTPGKIYMSPTGYTVPSTCKYISGDTAWIIGPGKSTGTAGFSFSNFYQGAGDIEQQAETYILPSIRYYQYGVYNFNTAFLRQYSDTIRNCVYGYFCTVTTSSNYCFEMQMFSRQMWHLKNLAGTTGGAFYMQNVNSAISAYQGNHCKAFYVDDCWAAVVQDSAAAAGGSSGNINNCYDILECDQSNYAVYNTKSSSSGNTFNFPAGITSPGNFQMFVNWNSQDVATVFNITTNDPTFSAANNFQWIGLTNRVGIAIQSGGIPTLYVSPSGSDTTGTGHDSAPFATIQRAVNMWQALDLYGQTVYVAVRDGTYAAGATVTQNCNGTIAIIGDTGTPANVVINGTMAANGNGTILEVSGMLINGAVVGQNYGTVQIAPGIVFGPSSTGFHVYAQNFGTVQINSNYSVTGGATTHYSSTTNGVIYNAGASGVGCTGTFSFTNFAVASQGGQLSVPGIAYTGSGVAGTRYIASLNGVIWTNGGGASYFPGTSAGSTSTGGQYA